MCGYGSRVEQRKQKRLVSMKQLSLVVMSVLAAASFTSSVMADDGQVKKGDGAGRISPAEKFKKADTNSDGKLSLDEFKAGYPKADDKKFAAADTDKDGFLTPEELKAARGKKRDKPADKPAQ